jgi:hypothetical protein
MHGYNPHASLPNELVLANPNLHIWYMDTAMTGNPNARMGRRHFGGGSTPNVMGGDESWLLRLGVKNAARSIGGYHRFDLP